MKMRRDLKIKGRWGPLISQRHLIEMSALNFQLKILSF